MTIPPALTPDQWVDALEDDNLDRLLAEGWCDRSSRHATAALNLHDQPFGFTWDDVRHLRLYAEEAPWMDELASRIAALLPPSQPWGAQVMYHDIPPEKP